jgi:hypothetical protein
MVAPSQEDGMRIFVVFGLVLLAGCSTQAEREAHKAHQIYAQRAFASSQAGGADQSCTTKVQFAMAGYRERGVLGLETMARANQLHAQCMDYWRRTGQMP